MSKPTENDECGRCEDLERSLKEMCELFIKRDGNYWNLETNDVGIRAIKLLGDNYTLPSCSCT